MSPFWIFRILLANETLAHRVWPTLADETKKFFGRRPNKRRRAGSRRSCGRPPEASASRLEKKSQGSGTNIRPAEEAELWPCRQAGCMTNMRAASCKKQSQYLKNGLFNTSRPPHFHNQTIFESLMRPYVTVWFIFSKCCGKLWHKNDCYHNCYFYYLLFLIILNIFSQLKDIYIKVKYNISPSYLMVLYLSHCFRGFQERNKMHLNHTESFETLLF